MAEHISFQDALKTLVHESWGKRAINESKLAQEVLAEPGKLAGIVLLEFLRALQLPEPKEDEQPPKNCQAFADKEVGDFVYWADGEEGLVRNLIVGRDSHGFALVVRADINERSTGRWFYASEMHATPEAALRAAAESDLEYYSKPFQFATDCLAAIRAKGDLTRFMEGYAAE